MNRQHRQATRFLVFLLVFLLPVSAALAATEVRNYQQLKDAAANKDTAIKIMNDIKFGAGDAAVVFDYDVTITADTDAAGDTQYSLSRDDGPSAGVDGRLIVVSKSKTAGDPNELTMENLIVSGGQGGTRNGGAVSVDGNATLTNMTFSDNQTSGNGGAVYVTGVADVYDSTFTGNLGKNGAGAYLGDGSSITGGEFEDNVATQSGGGAYINGEGTVGGTGEGEGVLFQRNTATGNYGGGLYTKGKGDVTNSTFIGNKAVSGGGAYLLGTTEDISNVVGSLFEGNEATSSAGGLYIYSKATVGGDEEGEGVIFKDNKARLNGGGLYVNREGNLKNNTFEGNSTTTGSGGGAYLNKPSIVTGGKVVDNTANKSGGGMYLAGQGTHVIGGDGDGEGVLFQGNRAEREVGGGLHIIWYGELTNNTFEGNYAAKDGGGLSAFDDTTITGGHFKDNTAGDGGGGVHISGKATIGGTGEGEGVLFEGNTAEGGYGGGLHIVGEGTLANNTFTGNESTSDGGGVRIRDDGILTNNTFTGNTSGADGGGANVGDGSIITGGSFDGNTAENNGGGAYIDGAGTIGGTGEGEAANFENNTATNGAGGAIYQEDAGSGNLTINDGTFTGNTSATGGGNITSTGDVVIEGDVCMEDNDPEGNQGYGIEANSLELNGSICDHSSGPSDTSVSADSSTVSVSAEPEPTPTPPPPHPEYKGITYSAQWCWQLYLDNASRDFRLHALEGTADAPEKGDMLLHQASVSRGPDGKKQLSLRTDYTTQPPLLVALSPEFLERLVKMEINTVAVSITATGDAVVYDMPDLLAVYEGAGIEAKTLWIMGLDAPIMAAVMEDGSKISIP